MTIRLQKGRYFVAIVYAEIDFHGDRGNFHGALYRDENEMALHFLSRLRWYVDDRMDDQSKDPKEWVEAVGAFSAHQDYARFEEACLDNVRETLDRVCSLGGGYEPQLLILRSSDQAFVLEQVAKQKWANIGTPSLFQGAEIRGRA